MTATLRRGDIPVPKHELRKTEIGTIGADWKLVRLKDVAEKPQYGLTAKAAKSGKTRFLRITDITDSGVNWSSVPFCSGPAKKLESCRLKSGDIVFARIGATTGKSYLIKDPPEAVFASYLIRVRAGDELDPCFLSHFFKSRGYWQQVDANKHSNLKKGVNGTVLSDLLLPLPPLPEQKRIAHILSTVQRAIEAQERIIQTTTELKKALMHKLFTEGTRGEKQKDSEIGPVPVSWEVVRLSDVCRFQSGGTPSKKNPEYWQGTIPWVSPKDMKRPRLNDVEDHISQEALDSGSKLAPAGSVFVVVRGMILAKTVPVALAEVPMAINQDMKAIVPGSKLRSDFLLYALETFRDNLFKKVGRSGHGTCTLMGHEVAAFKIPLPDMGTQEVIASAIQNLDRKKSLHEEKRQQLHDVFRTLLHELMTAKARV
ncbi:restriction endonuclease subunit S [Haloferula sargassicola]|uniref:Type I restriction modification DNA specificity domain-containing protein n=1 Tax=Haloferula sargassicola TaxID=490096 RepID=A0ABP9US67_9BACT